MITDLDTARAIVQQIYPAASDPILGVELTFSKGELFYRPYFVAAKFLATEYRQVIKADTVSFNYDKLQTIKSLLKLQGIWDKSDEIPPGLEAENLIDDLTCPPDCSDGSDIEGGLAIGLLII